jgi:hypothetical protein
VVLDVYRDRLQVEEELSLVRCVLVLLEFSPFCSL